MEGPQIKSLSCLNFLRAVAQKTPLDYRSLQGDLEDFNPYECNFFISHRWVSPSQPYNDVLINALVSIIKIITNRIVSEKFLPVSNHDVHQMMPYFESVFDRLINTDGYEVMIDVSQPAVAEAMSLFPPGAREGRNRNHVPAVLADIHLWVDFICLPQGERSDAEEEMFRYNLERMNGIAEHSFTLCMWDGSEFTRGWCVAEYVIASRLKTCSLLPLAKTRLECPFDVNALPSDSDGIRNFMQRHNMACSNGSDISHVSQMLSKFLCKYEQLEPVHFATGTHLDRVMREKIVQKLASLYTRGSLLLSPVTAEYIRKPPLDIDHDKYTVALADKDSPYYWSAHLNICVRPILTDNPRTLIDKYRSIQPDFRMSFMSFFVNDDLDWVLSHAQPVYDAPFSIERKEALEFDFDASNIHNVEKGKKPSHDDGTNKQTAQEESSVNFMTSLQRQKEMPSVRAVNGDYQLLLEDQEEEEDCCNGCQIL